MNTAAFCDADTLATWIFNWTMGCLALAVVTYSLKNIITTNKFKKEKLNRLKYEGQAVKKILTEIQDMQKNVRHDYESATNEHEKSKALFAYEQINECLQRFHIIKVPEKIMMGDKNDESIKNQNGIGDCSSSSDAHPKN